MEVNKYQLEVNKKGKLPEFSFPGLYPIYYVTSQNNVLCFNCATKEPENIANNYIHWEGSSFFCNNCNEEIKSAYGEVEEE